MRLVLFILTIPLTCVLIFCLTIFVHAPAEEIYRSAGASESVASLFATYTACATLGAGVTLAILAFLAVTRKPQP